MSYLKPEVEISIKGKKYKLVFSLDVIDTIQEKAETPIDQVIQDLTDINIKIKEAALRCVLRYLTGEDIKVEKDELDYYGIILSSIYMEQMQPKEYISSVINENRKIDFFDVEYWFYVAKCVLGFTKDEALQMPPSMIATLLYEHTKFEGWKKDEPVAAKDNVISF